MDLPYEVIMYINNLKKYLNANKNAHNYLIGDSDENLFFEYLEKVALNNFEKNGDPQLNRDQMEILRKTIRAIDIIKKDPLDIWFYYKNDRICLN